MFGLESTRREVDNSLFKTKEILLAVACDVHDLECKWRLPLLHK